MDARVEHYEDVVESAYLDPESITYLLVSGSTREEVAATLGVDLQDSRDPADIADDAAWAFAEIPGGVLAMENSGYADPSTRTLRTLAQGGRAAAVARSNIQGHDRFGYARDGDLVFDADNYSFVDSVEEYPQEMRELASLAWSDPDDEELDTEADGLVVALALAEQVTGLAFDAEDTERAAAGGFFAGPSLVHPGRD